MLQNPGRTVRRYVLSAKVLPHIRYHPHMPPSPTTPLTGTCLCKSVQYAITGPLQQALHCHCSMCRKAQGSAFRTRATVRSADFRFVQGEDLVRYYASSPGNLRGFCSVCGSPIHTKFTDRPDVMGLPLGGLDTDPGIRPEMHVCVAHKAPWHTITDDLPQWPEFPDT